jgi:phage terminase large subunit GpA-like protein
MNGDIPAVMRAIMDALSPSQAKRRVVFMKAAQVGATEAGNNWIGYVIHHAPGPMLCVQPTVELAKRFSRQRVDPLIEESPILRARVKPSRSRDAGNTVLSKEFPAGLLVMTGANSAVGLRSMPARYLFLDEVDAYPPSADEEGDPVALAEAPDWQRLYERREQWQLGTIPSGGLFLTAGADVQKDRIEVSVWA